MVNDISFALQGEGKHAERSGIKGSGVGKIVGVAAHQELGLPGDEVKDMEAGLRAKVGVLHPLLGVEVQVHEVVPPLHEHPIKEVVVVEEEFIFLVIAHPSEPVVFVLWVCDVLRLTLHRGVAGGEVHFHVFVDMHLIIVVLLHHKCKVVHQILPVLYHFQLPLAHS